MTHMNEDTENTSPAERDQQHNRIRIPRSQKKKLARQRYREKRKLRRREKRVIAREQCSMQRREMLGAMTVDERKAFIQAEREAKSRLKEQEDVFIQRAYDNGLNICVNCTFHDCMNETETRSLAKQLSVVYGTIKSQRAMIKLSITGIHSDTKLYNDLQLFNVAKWKVRMYQQNYWEVYDPKNIVVLSPDAQDYIEGVTFDKVYIIGGLVDKTIQKKTTLTQAQQHGLLTQALPIPKYFPHYKKKVLNINAVIDILVMRANNSTWQHAFQTCLPTRAKRDTNNI